jgi:hypothetical protein
MEQEESTINIAPEGRKQPKKINQAWGSNPESRPSAYCIGKSRLTIGPTRLIVVQLLTFTPSRPSSLDHTHRGAKILRGCAALFFFSTSSLHQEQSLRVASVRVQS